MTTGCPRKTLEVACNRPYANCTPYQASIGELRNFPFEPNPEDINIIRKQIFDYSNRQAASPMDRDDFLATNTPFSNQPTG